MDVQYSCHRRDDKKRTRVVWPLCTIMLYNVSSLQIEDVWHRWAGKHENKWWSGACTSPLRRPKEQDMGANSVGMLGDMGDDDD